jgi:ribA/ribD-fused uncharacterized protein
MEVGFTGTRYGMNSAQLRTLTRILTQATGLAAGHHGDCVGSDSQFHKICGELDTPVILHPPDQPAHRAYCPEAAEVWAKADYLERNRQIVESSDCLIACPSGPEKFRSGTWATIRHARKLGKAILIVEPDGKVRLENGVALQSEILPGSWHFDDVDHDGCAVFWRTSERFGSLSNMAGGFPLVVNGILIQSSEALYQALRFPGHPGIQQEILDQSSPMRAKMKAKKDSRRERLTREDWNDVRIEIMRWCLRIKLYQHFVCFVTALRKTGERPIVEYSRKDSFWGATLSPDWTLCGHNQLGRLLVELRSEALAWLNSDAEDETPPVVQPLDIPQFKLLGKPIENVSSDPFEDMQIPTSGFGREFSPSAHSSCHAQS